MYLDGPDPFPIPPANLAIYRDPKTENFVTTFEVGLMATPTVNLQALSSGCKYYSPKGGPGTLASYADRDYGCGFRGAESGDGLSCAPVGLGNLLVEGTVPDGSDASQMSQ